MKDTSAIGAMSETAAIVAFLSKGYSVFTPLSAASRADMIIMDSKGKILRIQCKTGRLKPTGVQFRNYSVTARGERSYTKEEIDAFAVYCPENDKAYLIPIEKCGKKRTTLKFQQSENFVI